MSEEAGADRFAARVASLAGEIELHVRYLTGRALARRVDPDDLTQEVLVRLLRSTAATRASDECAAALRAVARTVARNVVVDAARRARLAPRRMSSLLPEPRRGAAGARAEDTSSWTPRPAARGPGPATLAGAAEDARALSEGFAALSPEHRRVIGLRRFEGLSAAEAARRMGRSETAVHSLFRRALEAWDRASRGAPDGP
ncbi:MAG: RNA polymerase sigma factor [Planctomycetota bacterium]